MAPNPRPGRFSTETPLERERRLQIQREQRRRRRQQETAEQKEHRLAQRRQHRQQERTVYQDKISGRCGEVVVRGGSTVNRTEIERNICV